MSYFFCFKLNFVRNSDTLNARGWFNSWHHFRYKIVNSRGINLENANHRTERYSFGEWKKLSDPTVRAYNLSGYSNFHNLEKLFVIPRSVYTHKSVIEKKMIYWKIHFCLRFWRVSNFLEILKISNIILLNLENLLRGTLPKRTNIHNKISYESEMYSAN